MQHQPLFKIQFSVITVLCLSSLLGTFQAGCTQTGESTAEEDHLEHHIPEHKPKTYTETVKELDTRMRTLLNQSPASVNQEEKQQLEEIIDWIPELAADSELKHKDWDEVKQLSTELKSVFQQTDFSQIDVSLVGRYFLLVVKLKQYSGRSETKKFQS
ncbi:MAG: hypothetical protein ACIAZJ_15235 [Gimesia chilikensis]|uniref:hypothetical protein n=1 Tax=Gimesia chilikensis TaxID=2605989 RepID=UPI00378D3005